VRSSLQLAMVDAEGGDGGGEGGDGGGSDGDGGDEGGGDDGDDGDEGDDGEDDDADDDDANDDDANDDDANDDDGDLDGGAPAPSAAPYGPSPPAPEHPTAMNVVFGEVYQKQDGSLVRYEPTSNIELNREIPIDPTPRSAGPNPSGRPSEKPDEPDAGTASRDPDPADARPSPPEAPDRGPPNFDGGPRGNPDRGTTPRSNTPRPPRSARPVYPPGESVEKSMQEAEAQRHNPFGSLWFYFKVRNKGPKDYKQLGKPFTRPGEKNPYEDAGNYNYGAMANALGLSLETALDFAGAAQAVASGGKVSGMIAILTSGDLKTLDNAHDQEMIRQGYADAAELWRQRDPLPRATPAPNPPLGPPSPRRLR
jgi:hypothetical protein